MTSAPDQPSHAVRVPVELSKAYRLLNHGPTVLVSAAHGGRRNVMAAAWNMPLDFNPPKVAVVIDKQAYTRALIEASGEFVLSVPPVALVHQVMAAGSQSGKDLAQDKFEVCGLQAAPASTVGAPLVEGCVAWLECKVLPEPEMAQRHDLFLAEVVAAWADPSVFRDGRWHLDHDAQRSLHHVAGGAFFTTGAMVQG
ncbi:MAG TPA: flavin reductase family protein [Aquabacterium sp.]|uniref:flavin reductase family protein n=1 Tax=Aquabacterium sp. TaxID=1872578 RepID=UPI002E37C4A4|nr:flavin reductase family protein [Aquabacterium sp.]HEX5357652.1 flavin reductase family protein [Aquabacterium sp.]